MTDFWVPPSFADIKTEIFRTHPFRCEDCGTTLYFCAPNYETRIHGKRIMLHGPSGIPLCGHCLGQRITKWFATPEDQLKSFGSGPLRSIEKCDICEEKKIVTDIIWDDWVSCRFGSEWWNGFKICQDCLVMCAESAPGSSSYSVSHGNKHFQVNEFGARIEPNQI